MYFRFSKFCCTYLCNLYFIVVTLLSVPDVRSFPVKQKSHIPIEKVIIA
jgi:hypothetical protein